ncbi:MAG: biopolymer transporter ExbD [Planctomycetota bacterium]|mgnify:CR=1 FL=1
MAGSTNVGEGSDNPVDINIVPMVDVIFCLCLFFMCSFHFKQLEGKIESWLPKDKGVFGDPVSNPILEEIRIRMMWNANSSKTNIQVNSRSVSTDNELTAVLLANINDYKRSGKTDVPAIIDAEAPVPWQSVVSVMDICKNINIEKIEFASPMPVMAPKKP